MGLVKGRYDHYKIFSVFQVIKYPELISQKDSELVVDSWLSTANSAAKASWMSSRVFQQVELSQTNNFYLHFRSKKMDTNDPLLYSVENYDLIKRELTILRC